MDPRNPAWSTKGRRESRSEWRRWWSATRRRKSSLRKIHPRIFSWTMILNLNPSSLSKRSTRIRKESTSMMKSSKTSSWNCRIRATMGPSKASESSATKLLPQSTMRTSPPETLSRTSWIWQEDQKGLNQWTFLRCLPFGEKSHTLQAPSEMSESTVSPIYSTPPSSGSTPAYCLACLVWTILFRGRPRTWASTVRNHQLSRRSLGRTAWSVTAPSSTTSSRLLPSLPSTSI